jgi:hypothetical protein
MSAKKPWEETWKGASAYVEDVDSGRLRAKIGDGCGERVALISAAPDMARALLAFISGLDGSEAGVDLENARLEAEAALTKAGVPLP